MLHGNYNAKNVKNDPKSDFSNLNACSSNSQGELSVYEIDILSYGSPKGRGNDGVALKNGKKWKFVLNDSEIVMQNESHQEKHEVSSGVEIPLSPLIKSHYPVLEALRVGPDSNEISFEKIDSKKTSTSKEIHHKLFSFKEKLEDKKHPSLDSKKSKERLKLHLGKLKEGCIEENDGKVKPKKNKKKVETDSVHIHHHEHHHYHLGFSKSQNNKVYLKAKRSHSPKAKIDESEQKNKVEQENRNNSAVNTSSTATYVCNQSQSLSHPKTDLANMNTSCTRKENSIIYLPLYSNSIDSFLGTSSDLVMAHTFSQTDLSKSSAVGEVYRKISIEPNAKDSQRMTQKKLSKTEYNELLKSLKVLDNYTNSKTTAKANVKVSHLKCECNTKKENEVEKIGNHSSEVVLSLPAMEKTCARESSNQSTTETTSDKNHYASYFSAKRRNESAGLKTISHLDLTKYLKQELKDIKNRLRDLEKLYSTTRMNMKSVDSRTNDLESKVTPRQEIHVFSTKTYIVKNDDKCSTLSTVCST